MLRCVRGAHFHHKCAPLPHRSATLDPSRSRAVLPCVISVYMCAIPEPNCHFGSAAERSLRCSGACVVLIFSFPGCSRLPLAVPGCSWAAPGLLLAAPGLLLAAPGCSWLLLAAPGCSWLPLAAIDVNSRSKDNNLFGVLRWDEYNLVVAESSGQLVFRFFSAAVVCLYWCCCQEGCCCH
jgi:hypothetical protein